MDAPPSRYRVVERDGRLVVIDSEVGGAPLTAKDLLPDDGQTFSTDPYPRENGDPEYQAAPPVMLDSRPRGNTISAPPSALANVAATVAGERRDDQGRLLLTTARWYDTKAPRTLALSDAAERQLGGAVLALLAAAIVAIFLVIMGDLIGWMIVFAAVFLAARGRPVTTLWIDRLASA